MIQQSRPKSPFAQPAFYKPLIFDVLAIASALWVGHSYAQFLSDASVGLMLVIALGVFSLFSSIQVVLTKSFRRRMVVLVLQAIAILIPFRDYGVTVLSVAAGVYLLFAAWGELLTYGELENNIEIRFFKSLHPCFRKLTTALVLVMLILYLPNWNEKHAFVPKENFQGMYAGAATLAKSFYPDVDFNSTFEALARGLARVELQKNPAFKDLSDASKETIIAQTASSTMDSVGKNIGAPISPEDSASDVLYNSILKLLADLKVRFGQSFLLVWALIAFLVIRGFGTIFYWIVLTLSFILYELLITSGFIKIIGITTSHEIVDF